MLSAENRKNQQNRPDLTFDQTVPPATTQPTSPDETPTLADEQATAPMQREAVQPDALVRPGQNAPRNEQYVENQGVVENRAYLNDNATHHDATSGTISESDYVDGPAPGTTRLHDDAARPTDMQQPEDSLTPEQIIEQHRERAGQAQMANPTLSDTGKIDEQNRVTVRGQQGGELPESLKDIELLPTDRQDKGDDLNDVDRDPYSGRSERPDEKREG